MYKVQTILWMRLHFSTLTFCFAWRSLCMKILVHEDPYCSKAVPGCSFAWRWTPQPQNYSGLNEIIFLFLTRPEMLLRANVNFRAALENKAKVCVDFLAFQRLTWGKWLPALATISSVWVEFGRRTHHCLDSLRTPRISSPCSSVGVPHCGWIPLCPFAFYIARVVQKDFFCEKVGLQHRFEGTNNCASSLLYFFAWDCHRIHLKTTKKKW